MKIEKDIFYSAIEQWTFEKIHCSNSVYVKFIKDILIELIKKNDLDSINKVFILLKTFVTFRFDGVFIKFYHSQKADIIKIHTKNNQDIFSKIQNDITLSQEDIECLKSLYQKIYSYYIKSKLHIYALKIWLVYLASQLLQQKNIKEKDIDYTIDELLDLGSIFLATLLTKKFFSYLVIVNNNFIYGLKNTNGSALIFLSSTASIGNSLKNYFLLNGIETTPELIEYYLEIAPKINSRDIPKVSHEKDQYCLFYIPIETISPDADKEEFMLLSWFSKWVFFDEVKFLPAWWCFITSLQTVEDQELFLAWIYSVFVADDKIRQIAYLQGEGRTGKSTIAKVIFNYCNKIFGDNFAQSYVIDSEDKSNDLLRVASRSHLLILPDVYKRNIFSIKSIKNITGDDPMLVKDNKQYKTENVYCKILIHSNQIPAVNLSSVCETSRVLFFPIDSEKSSKRIIDFRNSDFYKVNSSNSFYDKLFEEMPTLLKCAKFYYKKHKLKSQRNDCFLFSAELKQRMLTKCQDILVNRIHLFYKYNTHYSDNTNDKIFLTSEFFKSLAKFLGVKVQDIEDVAFSYFINKENFKNTSLSNINVYENYSFCYLQNRTYAKRQIKLAEAENREILMIKNRAINEYERHKKF